MHPGEIKFRERIIPAYAGSTSNRDSVPLKTADHPRIRGEHSQEINPAFSRRGSSPHTRGARLYGEALQIPGRIIPAYAGSTRMPSPSSATCSDHPRIRGEHVKGRPPAGAGGRIIPAYAGSTKSGGGLPARARDHPRIRGEHTRSTILAFSCGGSSPHTRGARGPDHDRDRPVGIIPAYAGSTQIVP